MTRFPCPYLEAGVELTDQREQHIAEAHPAFLPEQLERLADTLANPDEVLRSLRSSNARLFAHWYNDLLGGKYVVEVVMSDPPPAVRQWVITAYIARRLTGGRIEWMRN
jgi:hypothetical protein